MTSGDPVIPASRRADPTPAIDAKKAQKAANRKRIADSIARLLASGEPVNVKAVARLAQVHPDTVRRNEDLLQEVRRHRDQRVGRSSPPAAVNQAADSALRARLAAAQEEIRDLRKQLSTATRAAHQTLGNTPTMMDVETAEHLKQENAEMAVANMDLQAQVRDLRQARDDLHDELLASHDLNREYARNLTRSQESVDEAQREIARLRASLSR